MERKTTALGYVSDLVEALAPAQLLPSISSYEGLLEIMSKPPEGTKDIDPALTLVVMSEFNSLLNKARNENLSNVIPNLNVLYDSPDVARSPTKVNPVKVENPIPLSVCLFLTI